MNFLKPVTTASYDSYNRSVIIATCEPGTREDLLRSIREWVVSNGSTGVCLVNGMAGLGKSTIAKTISEWAPHRDKKHTTFLLATFFFSRREGAELRTASQVLPTLVFQLAKQNTDFRDHVLEILGEEPDWTSAPLSVQAKKILPAFETFRLLKCTPLIVLDALDECSPPGSFTLLSLLLAIAFPQAAGPKPVPFKILITSRPETKIVSTFNRYCGKKEYVHPDMDKSIVRSDIRRYLEQAAKKEL
jgi:hypothetical protein